MDKNIIQSNKIYSTTQNYNNPLIIKKSKDLIIDVFSKISKNNEINKEELKKLINKIISEKQKESIFYMKNGEKVKNIIKKYIKNLNLSKKSIKEKQKIINKIKNGLKNMFELTEGYKFKKKELENFIEEIIIAYQDENELDKYKYSWFKKYQDPENSIILEGID